MLNIVGHKQYWYIKGHRWLSARRFFYYFFLKLKRKLHLDKAFYPPSKSNVPIDIFIPAIDKDADMLQLAIAGARKNIMHPIKNIYIASPGTSTRLKQLAKKNKCIFVPEESVLPFKKEKINYIHNGENRNGWIYQMLLNLSSDTVCSQENILILNADTVFVAPQIFIYKDKPLFNLSDEYHPPYFAANKRLLGLKHKVPRSYITHYMMFSASVLKKFRQELEAKYKIAWYDAIINNIDKSQSSGFADFEVYGDYYREGLGKPCILNYWSNISLGISHLGNVDQLLEAYRERYRSVSLHNYNRD